jgi:RimJ/RimL family protein N-acetyltransferase
LGYCYLEGIGTEKDMNKAVKWTVLSAEHGDRDAQYNLASLYEEGTGLKKDLFKALFWYRKAALQDHDLAIEKCNYLYKSDILVGEHIVLRKAKDSDCDAMLKYVWSDEKVYKWMLFQPTFSIEDAKKRTIRSIEFQKTHYAYFVALKESDMAIGYCGIKENSDGVFEECGICIGREFQHLGYGKEIVSLLLDLAFNKLNAKAFIYSYYPDNIKSKRLAEHFGFTYDHTEEMIRPWDQSKMVIDLCLLTKEKYVRNK